MNMTDCTKWETFRTNGIHFIGLTDKRGMFHVWNGNMDNYGSYYSKESFLKMYATEGEYNLNLTTGRQRILQQA